MKAWVQNNQSEVSGYAAAISKKVYFGLQYGIHTISMSQVLAFLTVVSIIYCRCVWPTSSAPSYQLSVAARRNGLIY